MLRLKLSLPNTRRFRSVVAFLVLSLLCSAMRLSFAQTGFACAEATEESSIQLTCDPDLSIERIDFVSYGRPEGKCSYDSVSNAYSNNFTFLLPDGSLNPCHAPTSRPIVEKNCIGQNSCTFTVTSALFGAPCLTSSEPMRLAVSYVCPGGPITVPANNAYCGVTQNVSTYLVCPNGYISDIPFVSWGRAGTTGLTNYNGECATTSYQNAFVYNSTCQAGPEFNAFRSECLGKPSCVVLFKTFATDPCPGVDEYLAIRYTCSPTPVIFAENTRYCEFGSVRLTPWCPLGNIYSIPVALYGELAAPPTCGSLSVTPNCNVPAIDYVSGLCLGNSTCALTAPVVGDPCPGITKLLAVEYTCSTSPLPPPPTPALSPSLFPSPSITPSPSIIISPSIFPSPISSPSLSPAETPSLPPPDSPSPSPAATSISGLSPSTEPSPIPTPTPANSCISYDSAELSSDEVKVLVDICFARAFAAWNFPDCCAQVERTCAWPGVVCNAFSHVDTIDFPTPARLTPTGGFLSDELGKLTFLTVLNVQRLGLSGTIPASLGNLTSLTTLNLAENYFTGTIPNTLANLTSLTKLILFRNQLSSQIPTELSGLSTLTDMLLYGNNFSGSIPPEFIRLSSLQLFQVGQSQSSGLYGVWPFNHTISQTSCDIDNVELCLCPGTISSLNCNGSATTAVCSAVFTWYQQSMCRFLSPPTPPAPSTVPSPETIPSPSQSPSFAPSDSPSIIQSSSPIPLTSESTSPTIITSATSPSLLTVVPSSSPTQTDNLQPEATETNLLPIIIGVIVGVLVVAALIGLLVWLLVFRKKKKGSVELGDFIQIPKNFVELYQAAEMPDSGYSKSGSDYYEKVLKPNTPEYQLFSKIFALYCDGQGLLDANAITRVHSVLNPSIKTTFENQNRQMLKRIQKTPELFAKTDWKGMDRQELRKWTLDDFNKIMASFPWNEDSPTDMAKVFLAIHGTDTNVAKNITDTGFSTLSSIDAGYYGAGMYFTSSSKYALPYYSSRKNPALLICLLSTGSVFPVVEHRKEEGSLMGLPIRSGYQSHYVRVYPSGDPCKSVGDAGFNEIVVGQESQILPIYLVEFDKMTVVKYAQDFQTSAQVIMPDPSTRAEFFYSDSKKDGQSKRDRKDRNNDERQGQLEKMDSNDARL